MAQYRKLGRTSDQRKALLRNQVTNLLYHGKIVTTEAKAKEIRKIAEGLIALSGCLAGEVSRALQRNDFEEAKSVANWYKNTFGEDNYYLEIQNHGLNEQLMINPDLIKLSKELDIPLVATNDAHYVDKQDAKMQQVLICIQTNHTVGEDTGLEFGTEEFYLKSEEEMLESFTDCPDAVFNTAKIAERCNVTFEFGNTKLPNFTVPEGYDASMIQIKIMDKTATSVETTPNTSIVDSMKVVKYMWNGKIYIKQGNKVYDITGIRVK